MSKDSRLRPFPLKKRRGQTFCTETHSIRPFLPHKIKNPLRWGLGSGLRSPWILYRYELGGGSVREGQRSRGWLQGSRPLKETICKEVGGEGTPAVPPPGVGPSLSPVGAKPLHLQNY